jgi:ABC-type taurine transport system substrate-binding protein
MFSQPCTKTMCLLINPVLAGVVDTRQFDSNADRMFDVSGFAASGDTQVGRLPSSSGTSSTKDSTQHAVSAVCFA